MLDIMLPGEDGLEILKKLKANPKTKRASTPSVPRYAKKRARWGLASNAAS